MNNKLQQKEAAAGVLEYAMKHHRQEVVSRPLHSAQEPTQVVLAKTCTNFSVNNKLQQKEAATGDREHGMKHHSQEVVSRPLHSSQEPTQVVKTCSHCSFSRGPRGSVTCFL